jgi:lysophospholipid acyltransferase (LPLAT)-like uncharacterized protein
MIRAILRILLLTCRFKIDGKENLLNAIQAGPTLIALWHNRLLLIAPSLFKITSTQIFTAFVSNSRDGHILAAYTTSYRRGRVIRVSHNAKDQALRALIGRMHKTHEIPIITPDGPRGPSYHAKPGISLVAQETGATIVPFTWNSSRFWELSTWDRFRIPKPFSTIVAVFGDPLKLPQDGQLEVNLLTIQNRLKNLS